MKKLLTIAVATFAITAVNAYTAQQVGVTTISTTSQNTIIPVPFTSLTNSSTSVTAKDLVKTTGLAENTWLLYFDGAKYNAWKLNSSKVWEPGTYATIPGADVSPAANDLSVSAGGAMWIVLPSAGSVNITVYGSYVGQSSSTVTAGKTMLVANPKQTAAVPSPVGSNKGDTITILDGTDAGTYTYNGSAWGSYVKQGSGYGLPSWTAKTFSSLSIGAGFWYKSTGSSDVTINWN
ncbi:MAG: hypothetical protein II840_02005 [Kiritimatiellae bacterium]|nr:hypothetical protein [Kiritimatiellia bacterium]